MSELTEKIQARSAAWRRSGEVAGYPASVRGLAFHIAGHELHHLRILKDRYLPLLGERTLEDVDSAGLRAP